MKRTSPEKIKQEQEELKEWQMELTDVQRLLPVEAARNKLVARDIPELEQSIKESQKEIPVLTDAVNNVRLYRAMLPFWAPTLLWLSSHRHSPSSMASRRK